MKTEPNKQDFSAQVKRKAARKLMARRNPNQGVWFGLGMMGLIGWSVVVPTLLGAALGLWLDTHHSGAHSWTLALLIAGLTLGCFNAWHWVDKENQAMREQDNDESNPERKPKNIVKDKTARKVEEQIEGMEKNQLIKREENSND
jgi:ATP synthase protein I